MLTFGSNTVVALFFLLLFDTERINSNCTQQSQDIFESIVIKERIIHKLHSKHTQSVWMMLRFTAATVHYHFHSHSNHVRGYYYLTRSNFVLCFNAEKIQNMKPSERKTRLHKIEYCLQCAPEKKEVRTHTTYIRQLIC